MAPPTPPRGELSSSSQAQGGEVEELAPVSIASLRSRFESLSATNGKLDEVKRTPNRLTVSRPRTPTTISPQSTGRSISLSAGNQGPLVVVEEKQSGRTPAIGQCSGPGPSSPSDDGPLAGNENENRPVSVKAMKERFGAGSEPVAGPSKPKPPVPAKAAHLSTKTKSSSEAASVPLIRRMSIDGTVSVPISPLDTRSTTPPPISRSLSSKTSIVNPDHADSQDIPRPPSRGPSPKPPEPSRSTKPPPRALNAAPITSRSPSSSGLVELAVPTPVATAKIVPPLPVRKPSLPVPAVGDIQRPVAPPAIPGNRPSAGLAPGLNSPATIAMENALPKLPERPRAQTASRAEPALPPRLPQRQATIATETASPPRMPPRQSALPPRPHSKSISMASNASVGSLPDDNDTYQPPPPPTRSVGTVSTPPRRAGSGSTDLRDDTVRNGHDSQEEDEDDDDGGAIPVMTTQAQRILDDFPDSTNANRRPPSFVPDTQVHTLHQIHAFAIHGRHVCTGSHHVRVYDTLMSNQPIMSVDLKDTGLEFRIKEPRVSAMGFRPAARLADEGRYLWCGTKDGHLWELDIRTGQVTDTKQGVHGSAVAHILRYKHYLITLEETGKLHVFEIDRENEGPPTLIRTVRVSDRYTFARMIGGQLWTASAPPNRSTTNIASKGPTIRVYEPCTPGSMPPVKTLYATEWTGAVTSATIIPFRPNEVYLAHEGGYVSVWDAQEFVCLQVLKISSTDILALEGVGERLWTGNRKGQINVYDITDRPWRTTNVWTAHHDQAIHELYIDFRAIEDSGRFALWSCTKESLRAWDGLLSVDWIDQALVARQPEYCTFRDLKAIVCTWNIDSAKPTDLVGENFHFLIECLNSVDSPDIIVFGFQEVIPLTDKKLTAKTLLFGSNKKDTGSGDKVTMAYRHWIDKLTQAIRFALPDHQYVKIHSENLVGLMTCIFVKTSEKDNLRGLDITTVKRGIGGIYGNKGAIVARMIVDDTSLCFINVHLAAGQSQKAARNADLVGIMEDKAIFPPHDLVPFVHGGDGTGILDHEMVILNGDLNYRIDQRRENVISNVYAGDFDYLLEHDQLRKEMRSNHAFRLRSFEEAPITFAPTYKYNSGTNDYDSSEKRRIPAWCDRILYRKCSGTECINYRRYEPTVSDHKPVSAGFNLKIKSIDPLKMGQVKQELRMEWAKEEANILDRIMKAMPDIL